MTKESPFALQDRVHELANAVHVLGLRFLEGAHLSARAGQGLEFESLQPYTAGDDIRHLDWKKLAAADRAFVRRKHPEKKNHWQLILDQSPSMGFGSKWRYAQLFVGTLLVLFQRWGDSFTLWPQGFQSFDEVLEALVTEVARQSRGPIFEGEKALEMASESSASRVVMISDFMMSSNPFKKKEVPAIGIQILDPQEIEFPFSETLEFRDCESTAKILLPASHIKRAYLNELQTLQQEWKSFFNDGLGFFSFEADPDRIVNDLEIFFEKIK